MSERMTALDALRGIGYTITGPELCMAHNATTFMKMMMSQNRTIAICQGCETAIKAKAAQTEGEQTQYKEVSP